MNRLKDSLKSFLNLRGRFLLKPGQEKRAPLWVLGHDRSGSTWVGKTLGMAPGMVYLHEPINAHSSHMGDWEGYHQCLRRGDRDALYERIFDHAVRGAGVRYLSLREFLLLAGGRGRVLIKETGGMLAGEWLQSRYGGQVVLLLRHPAAVYASNRAMDMANAEKWLKKLMVQERLLADLPARARQMVEDWANAEPVLCFAMIYCLRYREALRQSADVGDWTILFYEDVCEDPLRSFATLYEDLGLSFTEACRQSIEAMCSRDGSDSFFGTTRKSREIRNKWKTATSVEEQAMIREVLEVFEFPYYRDSASWKTAVEDQ